MAWVSKDVVRKRLAAGRVATHTYYRAKERGPEGRVRLLGSFHRKSEAYAFLERVAREAKAPVTPVPLNGLAVGDLAARFLADRFPEWDPEGTALPARQHFRNSKQVLDRFAACVGADRPAATLTEEHVRAFTGQLVREGLKPASVHSYLAYVSRFLRWSHERRHLPEPVRVERRDPKVTRPALSLDELVDVFAKAKTYPEKKRKDIEQGRLVPVLSCLFYAGLRRGELVTLQWRDVILDVPHPAILIRHKPAVRQYRERFALVEGKRRRVVEEVVAPWAPKHGTTRVVPILAPLERVLRETRPPKPEPEAFVFTTRKGRPFSVWGLSTVLRRFGEACLGRPVGTHVFRRSFTTQLAARGAGAHVLQAVLGHRDIETTSRYVDQAMPLGLLPADALPDLTARTPSAKPLPAPPECAGEHVIGLAETPASCETGRRKRVRARRISRESPQQLRLFDPASA